MIRKALNILRQPEESDLYLCLGVEAVFFGAYQVYPPAAYIIAGLVFLGLAYLAAPPVNAHGVA